MELSEELASEFNFARLAMALDCEGSIMIGIQRSSRYRRNNTYYAAIGLTNTSRVLIEWLADNFGFTIYFTPSKNPKHKDTYQIKAERKIAKAILNGVRPYLIIKGEQADLALELQESMAETNGRIVPDETLDCRELLYDRCRELNRRGK